MKKDQKIVEMSKRKDAIDFLELIKDLSPEQKMKLEGIIIGMQLSTKPKHIA